MRTCCFLLVMMMFFMHAQAQGVAQNALFLEAGGANLFYSINYDRFIFKSKKNNVGARAGAMYWPLTKASSYASFPFGLSVFHQLKTNYLELGGTSAAIYRFTGDGASKYITLKSIKFGVRHQAKEKGLFWALHFQYSRFSRSVEDYISYGWIPGAGAGIGYSF